MEFLAETISTHLDGLEDEYLLTGFAEFRRSVTRALRSLNFWVELFSGSR
jgi:hypothetical protein